MSATGRGAKREYQDQYMTPMWAVEDLIEHHSIWLPHTLQMEINHLTLLDPCAGDGYMLRELIKSNKITHQKVVYIEKDKSLLTPCIANDLDFYSKRQGGEEAFIEQTDFLTVDPFQYPFNVRRTEPTRTICVTNPPYTYKETIVQPDGTVTVEKVSWVDFYYKAKEVSDKIVFLLRTGAMGAQKRKIFWNEEKRYLTDIINLSKRPAFRYPNSDEVLRHPNGKKKGTDASEYAWFVWDFRNPLQEGQGTRLHWI